MLPLLTLGLLVFQLDRMNIASALTGGLKEDIQINQSTVNVGNFLMFLGIIILEIPSNIILIRVGPRLFLPAQILIFGLIATLQVLVRNRAGFLTTRLILGICESGYIPGSLYVLSTWYKEAELARRVSIFFCGMFGGFALSPVLAAGILRLHEANGLSGWQWIFLIEGIFTMFVSFIILFLLPGSPKKPKSLFKYSLITFSDRDKFILQERLKADGRTESVPITLKFVFKTMAYWKRWPHFLATALVFGTWSPITTYTPSIFVSLGFNRIAASALTAVGGGLTLVVVNMFGWISDATGRRGFSVAIPIFVYLITLIILREVQPHAGRWGKFGLWTLVNAFAVGYHPVQNAWLQLNCRSLEERSISISYVERESRTVTNI